MRQLQVLRWSSPSPSASVAETAKALGVRADVLEEAIRGRALTNQRRGKPARSIGKRTMNRFDYALVRVTMPPPIYKDWSEYCQTLRVKPAAVLRSLIHEFLLTGNKPTTMTHEWRYRGSVYQLESRFKRSVPSAPTRITLGAQQVLDEYADHWSVKATAIMRGLVVDLLEGRTRAMKIVAFPELWGDPARYKRPPPPAPLPPPPPSRKKRK